MREVQRQLDHDLTLREFLIVKGQRRILRDLEEKERKKKEFEIQNLENQLRLYEDTLKQIQVHIKQRINVFVMIVFFYRNSAKRKTFNASLPSSSNRKRRTLRCSITLTN